MYAGSFMEEQDALSKLDELTTELLNKDPLTLAAISTIPYFGSTIATFYSSKWLAKYRERTDLLFRQFEEYLDSLDERTINKGYFDTDEGFDLLYGAIEQSAKTRSEDKRELIARILRGAVVEFAQENHSPEDYLYLISDLTVRELKVARTMYRDRPRLEKDAWNTWEEETCKELDIDNSDLHMSLDRLGSTGLLGLTTAREVDEDYVVLYSRDSGEGSQYIVTSSFDKLMKFLQLKA